MCSLVLRTSIGRLLFEWNLWIAQLPEQTLARVKHLLPIYPSEGRFSSIVLPPLLSIFPRMCSAFHQHVLGRFAVLVCISTPEIQDLALFLNAKKTSWGLFFPCSHLYYEGVEPFSRELFSFLYFHYLFFVGSGQIVCSSLYLHLTRLFSHSSRGFFFGYDASLIMALALPSVCLSAVCPESHSLHFFFNSSILLSCIP